MPNPPLVQSVAGSAWRTVWPIGASLVLAVCLRQFVEPHIGGYIVNLMIVAAINIMLAVSLTVVNGLTGQFSIGHAAFAGLGAYAGAAVLYYGTALWFGDVYAPHGGLLSWTGKAGEFTGPLLAKGDWLFLLAVVAGGTIAAIAGYAVGLPSLRLKGDYLAIVTLGFGEIARVLMQNTLPQVDAEEVAAFAPKAKLGLHLGSALGFNGVPTYTTVFWAWLAVGLVMFAVVRLKYSAYGRALLTVREDEIAASSMGVNLARYKIRAFVFAAFLAGVAGAIYAGQVGQITPTELGFQRSFDIIIMVVLGGLGSITGAALAAVLVTILPEILRDPPPAWPWGFVALAVVAGIALAVKRGRNWRGCLMTTGLLVAYSIARVSTRHYGASLSDYRMIIYALLLILLMILQPQGLLGLNEIWEIFRRRKQPPSTTPATAAPAGGAA